MDDKQFVNQFSAVLIVLAGISVVILLIARVIAHQPEQQDLAMKQIIEERIKPIGEVNVGSIPAQPEAASMPAATGTENKQLANAPQSSEKTDPAQVYQTVCSACHQTGLLNAPAYGNKAAWAPLLGDINALYTNAINGKGVMPAKGGHTDLTDETIKATVDYMIEAVR